MFETVYLRLGLKLTWQGLCAMLNHSVVSNWDLRLAKTHSAWFRELMKLRFLMSHCRKNLVRDKVIVKWVFREKHTSRVGHHRGQVP